MDTDDGNGRQLSGRITRCLTNYDTLAQTDQVQAEATAVALCYRAGQATRIDWMDPVFFYWRDVFLAGVVLVMALQV